MKIHFIAIGGSAMHNLAIALSRKGAAISGSDDEIFEPSKSRLAREGILPSKMGWDANRITKDLDAVVLGMHAREDNLELAKAKELGIKVYSYPEYVYEQTREKVRVVIGGSHGKTSITSILLHVLQRLNRPTDYLVGAQLEGYDCMVSLNDDTEMAVIEGDEYLSSPIDRRPKFHLYRPNIALITGIAWDHINVFPSWDNYVAQFQAFIDLIEPDGYLIYYKGDSVLKELAANARKDIRTIGYDTHENRVDEGYTSLLTSSGDVPIGVFGRHNLQNISGAMEIASVLGISDKAFYSVVGDFSGASKRMEKVAESGEFQFYKDFAHAPSKLKATTTALKEQFPGRPLVACMELHTFSSLNKEFIPHYKNSMAAADRALVYFSPEVVEHKKLPALDAKEVRDAFGTDNVEIFTDSKALVATLKKITWKGKTLLMMSSGNFDGIDFKSLGEDLVRVVKG